MNVDLEAIAQRGRCDVSNLRIALPLLEQGYSPPFLARYRRDELGGLDEASLWALSSAVQAEQTIARRREELLAIWEATPLQDPAIGHAIRKSNSIRMLERLGRRLKSETADHLGDSVRLAVRVINPHKGDGSDFAEIAAKVEGIQNPASAVAGLDAALAKRLAGDPRIISAAVRWLVKNARIHIASIHDPHIGHEDDASADPQPATSNRGGAESAAAETVAEQPKTESAAPENAETPVQTSDPSTAQAASPPPVSQQAPASEPAASEPAASEPAASEPAANEPAEVEPAASESAEVEPTGAPAVDPPPTAGEPVVSDLPPVTPSQPEASPGDDQTAVPDAAAADSPATAGEAVTPPAANRSAKGKSKKKAAPAKVAKKQKKVSPRQRRRRWLVSVLKPLEGKRIASGKLSAFQVVMLGRALRSQVAQCSFEYDATKLVAELQRTAGGFNRHVEEKLREIVLQNEADIREAAEGAWWDELQERASVRLVGIAADHLRRQTDRGGVEAKVVMSIDAVGPRTAATAIVAADGRLLHSEDLPCQLSSAPRSQAVARMGELIHTYHVDLIVISNGPARRACMVAAGDLIAQSPAKSLRWTLADRSGADAYAGSPIADREMKSTPRRFRAAAWLVFSVLQPAQALAKVDPLKLRLGSFQRELSEEALLGTLNDVMVSGASRGGVDVNTTPVSWLSRLPGVWDGVAKAIDLRRRESLFKSRQQILELETWPTAVDSRQAIPFLRVFDSDEVLDGTLIHPDDYPLAKKLAAALDIELPPPAPPGYVAAAFENETEPQRTDPESSRTSAATVVPSETAERADFQLPDEPELGTTQPTADAEPTAAAPEPTAAEPEPTATEPEPTATEPEPTATEPEPTAAEPEKPQPDAGSAPSRPKRSKRRPAPWMLRNFLTRKRPANRS